MRRAVVLALATVVLAAGSPLLPRAEAAAVASTRSEVAIRSFDGTLLHAYVFRPTGTHGPVTPIVTATPYDNTGGSIAGTPNPLVTQETEAPGSLVDAGMFDRGYAFVQVALRGTGGSGGCFDVWGPATQRDLAVVIAWAAAQPWSTGKVVTWGASAGGISQIAAIAQHPPALRAAVVEQAPVGSGEVWTNGVINSIPGLAWGPTWLANAELPPSIETPLDYWVQANGDVPRRPACPALQALAPFTDADSAWWHDRDRVIAALDGSTLPMLWIGGFHDYNAREPAFLDMFHRLAGPRRAYLGQYEHGIDRGPTGTPFGEITLDWYDHVLHGTPFADGPTVMVQDDRGTWRGESTWPPATTSWAVPIHSGTYVDLPTNSAEAELPGAITGLVPVDLSIMPPTGIGSWTVSNALPAAVRFAGSPTVAVRLRSAARHVGLVALVYDIDPSGGATLVTRGTSAARGRDTTTFTLSPQDWQFRPGHRIGVLVTGSDLFWYTPASSGLPVVVLGGTLRLPVQACEPPTVSGPAVPDFAPRTPPPPFAVPAATLAAAAVTLPPVPHC
jgi:predicted acyl esterase